MNTLLTLDALGPRICIMGPSNSGKSTLADAISRKTSLPVVYLDQLHHVPGSQWRPRATAEFLQLHTEAVSQDRWVIEGNYTRCLEERLAHATGLILLDVSVPVALLRYIRRCFSSARRIGGLGSDRDPVTLAMLKYIIRTAPQNRKRHQQIFDRVSLPKIQLHSLDEIKACSEHWALNVRR
ncbi:AAA family ATPase [Pantoea sp. NSTU24]|uniref:AAA family ATPase n=1 Tax=Pantoea sp. NSTU24 TaxID=3391144 RepID=UPI003D0781B4